MSISSGKNHLWRMIQAALDAAEFYQPHLEHLQHIPEDEESITLAMHDSLVDRIRSWNRFYALSPETFFLAVNTLDRFLSLVKARPHHLMCVTVASYYLSVKIGEHSQVSTAKSGCLNEIDSLCTSTSMMVLIKACAASRRGIFAFDARNTEDVMSPEDLVRISQCGCTTSDIARMENIILQKLGWDMEAPTTLSFLQLFHAYCVVSDTLGVDTGKQTDHLDIITRKLEACMCHFPLTLFKPSILAMSLLISELPEFINTSCDVNHAGSWSRVLASLQYAMKMSDCELLECQTILSEFLTSYSSPECKRPTSRLSWIISSRTAKQLRFSAHLSSTLEPIPEHDWSMNPDSMDQSDSLLDNTNNPESLPTNLLIHSQLLGEADATAPSIGTNKDRCHLWEKGVVFRYQSEKIALCPLIDNHVAR